jgi:hypothetical protein
MSIVLRFVRHDDAISSAILLRTGGDFAHVEAVTPAGKYLGAFGNGYADIPAGVSERPRDYDNGRFVKQRFMLLEASSDMSTNFYRSMHAAIGLPYDWGGAGAFLYVDAHEDNHVLCSSFITLELRGCAYFPAPLSLRAHLISPRDLELGLSMRPDVHEIQSSDPVFLAHISEEKAG